MGGEKIGCFLQLCAVAGVGNLDQGGGSLAQILSVEFGYPVFGDNIVDLRPRRYHPSPFFK